MPMVRATRNALGILECDPLRALGIRPHGSVNCKGLFGESPEHLVKRIVSELTGWWTRRSANRLSPV